MDDQPLGVAGGTAATGAFGGLLRQRRRALDLTQEALAERTGCSVEMIKKLEAGRARPSRQLAELLAAALELPVAEHAAFVQAGRAGGPADLRAAFPDGTWFVALAPLTDPAFVLPAIAGALGLREAPGQSVEDLRGLGAVAAAQVQPLVAARLFAAADALLARMQIRLDAVDQASYARARGRARQGADPAPGQAPPAQPRKISRPHKRLR